MHSLFTSTVHSWLLFSSVMSGLASVVDSGKLLSVSVKGDWTVVLEELPWLDRAMLETPEVDGSDFFEASAALRTVAVVSWNPSSNHYCHFLVKETERRMVK